MTSARMESLLQRLRARGCAVTRDPDGVVRVQPAARVTRAEADSLRRYPRLALAVLDAAAGNQECPSA